MSPDYRRIYNEIIASNENYNRAENSPGFLNCVKHLDRLKMLHGRAIDVGCGVGFVCQLLSQQPCRLDVYGVDVSDEAIERTRQRLIHLKDQEGLRFQRIENSRLPYPDDHFALVTCFDVLEHLDESDIRLLNAEIARVLRRGGIFFGSVSCRPAGALDLHGDNLHRTVKKTDWWIEALEPDEASFERHDGQLTLWKKNRKKATE
jgi:SAM-dependent methyltransferase